MRNRLKELREVRGLKVAELAKAVGTTASKIYKLEDGSQRLTDAWLAKLAPALRVAPADIIATGPLSVPMTLTIAAAFSEHAPFDLPEPHERIYPPRSVLRAEECVAAHIADDSADRIYPPGSVLIVRPLAKLKTGLRLGQKVVVRKFRTRAGAGDTMEVLVGLLDRAVTGELVAATATRNRELPPSVRLKELPAGAGLADRQAWFRESEETPLDYRPEPGDPAEIVGLVVMAMRVE